MATHNPLQVARAMRNISWTQLNMIKYCLSFVPEAWILEACSSTRRQGWTRSQSQRGNVLKWISDLIMNWISMKQNFALTGKNTSSWAKILAVPHAQLGIVVQVDKLNALPAKISNVLVYWSLFSTSLSPPSIILELKVTIVAFPCLEVRQSKLSGAVGPVEVKVVGGENAVAPEELRYKFKGIVLVTTSQNYLTLAPVASDAIFILVKLSNTGISSGSQPIASWSG